MRIKSVRASCRDLALIKPYTIAYETIDSVENVFLEIELFNGLIGIGAANPDPDVVGESPEQTLQNLQTDWVAALIGQEIQTFQLLIQQAQRQFPDAPGTVAALDIALHDAFGQYTGVPVVKLYGQKIQSLPTSVTIGIMNVADTLTEAAAFYQQGFRILKIKTGLNPAEDVERLRKLREHYGQALTIRVDANQGYTLPQLQAFLALTDSLNLELVEQPLPVGQERQMLALPDKTRQRMAADESLRDNDTAQQLATPPPPFGIFNIKLMKCGGIRAALDIARVAEPANISLFWGCNDESRVSITAALHAAFACPHTRYLDLDGSFDLADDVVSGGFVVKNGVMRLAGGTGLGLKPL